MYVWRSVCTYGGVCVRMEEGVYVWRSVCTYGGVCVRMEECVYVWRREHMAGSITSPIKPSYQHNAQTSTWGKMSYFDLSGQHLRRGYKRYIQTEVHTRRLIFEVTVVSRMSNN